MKWKEEYATGVQVIDEQHKFLFKLSEVYRETLEADSGEETFGVFLDTLKDYAELHFDFEERCMLEHLCPVAKRNCREHGLFCRVVEMEQKKYKSHGFDRQRALALTNTIDQWLDRHICNVDRKLAEYV